MKTVDNIILEYLEANGYGGLYNDAECACKIDDLVSCGEMAGSCTPGYLVDAPSGNVNDFYICASKDDRPWE